MAAQKSIVLVTVDCLRADHTGFMGYQPATTPFLDSLAAESFVFPAAIVAGAPTYYSLPAILASRYPLALGRDVLGVAPEEPTLASVLKDAGYATAALVAANPYISGRFGYEQGFDTFRDFLEEKPAPLADFQVNVRGGNGWASRLNLSLQKINSALGPFRFIYDEVYFRYCQRVLPVPGSIDALRRFPAADEIVDCACGWLSSVGDGPFFLWLHLMDPHGPYYPKENALAMMGQSGVTPSRAQYLNSYWNRSDLGARRLARHSEEVVALYDAGIRWVDAQMERLVAAMRGSGQWDHCIFAFTADHGEEFLDHGGRYHPPSRLMEELIHVPLLVRVPGSTKKVLGKNPFSLVHLAPTLLGAARVPAEATFQGRNFWPDMEAGADEVAIAECVAGCTNPFWRENRMGPRVLAVRDARYKLLLHFDPATEYLYDLEADPGERVPLASEAQRPVRRRLLEAAREHLRAASDPQVSNQRARTQTRLRELRLEWARPVPQRADNIAHLDPRAQ